MELSKQKIIVKKALPVVLGGAVGYAYYYWIGCVSGTCPITSNPWISTGYGMFMGFLLAPGLLELLTRKKAKE